MSAPVTEAHRELLHQLLMNVEHGYLKEAAQLIADSEALACAELRALVGTIRSQLNLIPRNVGDITPEGHSHETGAAIDQLRAEVERWELAFQEQYARAESAEREVERLKDHAFDKDGTPWKTVCGWWSKKYDTAERQMGENAARAERAEASLHALRLVCGTTDVDKFSTWVDRANTRAKKAEAELATAKAIIASIEEDGTEEHNAAVRLRRELAAERARLDWLELRGPWDSWNGFGETGITLRENIRAAIDAAMKEGAA